MNEIEFCITCGKMREYEVRTFPIKTRHKAVHFEYQVQIPFCKVCGAEMYSAELNDANVDAALAAYERAKGDSHE